MKTFGESVYEWMVKYKKTSVKPSTYDRLETSYKLMNHYKLSYVPLDEIDEDYMQEYINTLMNDGYALSTIKKQYHLITEYMDYANVKGIIDRPYDKAVNLPSRSNVKKVAKDAIGYTPTEQNRLKEILWTLERPAYGAALLMLETGMRVGEALAVGFDDVDFGRRCISVHKTFVHLGNHRKSFIQQEAKSFASNRTIPLSKDAMRLINELKLRSVNDDFIIQNGSGDPLNYEALRWRIHRACIEANVPYYGQHAFRHTFATNCYYKGCDVKRLSKLLGHSDVSITYNVYIHLFGDELEDMRSVVD